MPACLRQSTLGADCCLCAARPCRRGKDIGSALMKHIVARNSTMQLYLTTLRATIPFYEAAGFRLLQVSEVPW